MAVTESFSDLLPQHFADSFDLAHALLREGIDPMLTGDVKACRAILREDMKARIGFEKRPQAAAMPSLMRVVGLRADPRASSRFDVIATLQRQAGVELQVAEAPRQPGSPASPPTAPSSSRV